MYFENTIIPFSECFFIISGLTSRLSLAKALAQPGKDLAKALVPSSLLLAGRAVSI